MIKNQIWFDEEYSEEKYQIKSIRIISGGNFQGQLAIEDYTKLEKLFLRSFNCIENVTLKNLVQLKECIIWDCGITDLVIENCPQIKRLNVRNNQLTSLEFLKSLEKSEELNLDISYNNFLESNLKPFSSVINLYSLNIGNSLRRKVLWGRYNRFFGSLKHLVNSSKLRDLDISNTDIEEGLEDLPESLTKIACSNDLMISLIRENKCSKIVQELKDYWISGNCYDLNLWRESQPFYLENNRLQKELETRENQLRNTEILLNTSFVYEDNYLEEVENSDLQKKVQEHELMIELPPK